MERGFKLTSYGETFSRREIEILGLIAQGWSNQAIADQLCLSLETVKWYNTQVYGKLGVSSRTQAIARARQTGILDTLVQLNSYPSTYSKHNLPEDLTPYIGRQQERYDLHRLLLTSSVCLLTIIGAGGK